ncbi:nucleoside triphosphate pyrophosphohydrolase family protein [Aeromicrobium yanjiei]|uniref:Pyrophosphatase n=1 Tax=Aeromicrobium yanjiei TaxID=2662028 RepID=A0A5Q2MJV0_9ACTN|nr:nucleoside triphosphate pyrophosphohydrolase family protein [Aeromicrobium yanjiei]QGG41312.1 hypothetical protein GEV26_07995 [Aeromicrobium yanjiei]
MNFDEYQLAAQGTDQRGGNDIQDVTVHLLGLAGEAGSVASVYKKRLRDGTAFETWNAQAAEELGDLLWYLATVASKLDLSLQDIATANLEKTRHRWLTTSGDPIDGSFPPHERLPRSGTYEFVPDESPEGTDTVSVYFEGRQLGSTLTDASPRQDGYRFHDVFHLAYASVLGWSPVTRQLMSRKRKSDVVIDESEDGGRAIVVEEAIAALAFAYGAQHKHLDGISRLDQHLLNTILLLTDPFEASVRSAADWERAILRGHEMFRLLLKGNGGRVHFDANLQSLRFEPRNGGEPG